ncbi:hypothetical protein [Micromonospora sp. NPDC051141]|uniref:hypothetical protein n=1 Tax=Micromonospora sp. NPDC051141 TaxID=3364284 RepID=UPI0037AC805B
MTAPRTRSGRLPTTALAGLLVVALRADAVPLLGLLVPDDAATLAAVGRGPAGGAATG